MLYTVLEASARLRVSRSTIYNLLRDKRLKSVRIGASRRILAESVDAIIAEGLE